MIGLFTDADASVVVAFVAAAASITAATLGWLNRQKVNALPDHVDEIPKILDTGNGHSAGAGIARIEEGMWRLEHRIDRLDVKVDELREFARDNRDRIEDLEDE